MNEEARSVVKCPEVDSGFPGYLAILQLGAMATAARVCLTRTLDTTTVP